MREEMVGLNHDIGYASHSLKTIFTTPFQNYIPYRYVEEEFEDTKVIIRIRISKKNRQHNGQRKNDKRTNNEDGLR
jgi:hypothetical protein